MVGLVLAACTLTCLGYVTQWHDSQAPVKCMSCAHCYHIAAHLSSCTFLFDGSIKHVEVMTAAAFELIVEEGTDLAMYCVFVTCEGSTTDLGSNVTLGDIAWDSDMA